MRGPAIGLAILFLMLAPQIGSAADGAAATWRVALTIDSATARPAKAFEAFDTASLNLYDFNGDGQLEIVSNNDNNRAYVLDSRTGAVLAEIETFHFNQSRWPVRELNPIAIGDVYGDGRPCLVIPNSASYLSAWCYDAAQSTATSFKFEKKWEVLVDAAEYEADFWEKHPWMNKSSNPSMDGHAFLADANKDGKKEIYVETDGYPGQFAFNHDGSYRWSRSFADGNAGAKVLDFDKDGKKDAVFVSDGGLVTAYDASTGSIKWNFDARKNGASPGSIPVAPLVADLHGDGKYETVFGARNVSSNLTDPNWINESHAVYFALDSGGKLLWKASYDWMNPLQYNHPAGVDVNGDGVLDIVALDWNTIGHKPGDWETTNRPSNLFVLDGRDGSVIWRRGINVYWGNKDFVIADVDGDGGQEVVAPTAKGGSDGLGVYDLKTGAPEGWIGLAWQASRGPVAGDLYGDGKLYLVVPIAKKSTEPNYRSLDVGLRMGALVIMETGAAYNVKFSANILNSEDQKESQKGTNGTPPPTPPPVTTTAPPPTPTTTTSPPVTTTSPISYTPPTTTSTPPPATTQEPATTTTTPATNATTTTTTTLPPQTGTTPPTESATQVPGPAVALLLAAAAAVAVLLRRR